jgi:hypothetical protein
MHLSIAVCEAVRTFYAIYHVVATAIAIKLSGYFDLAMISNILDNLKPQIFKRRLLYQENLAH